MHVLYRKHHCPIHLSTTGTLIIDRQPNASFSPKTNYQETFRYVDPQSCQRSLIIPPVLQYRPPTLNKQDMLTVTQKSFKQYPVQAKQKLCKPQEAVRSSGSKLQTNTSYKDEYPPRKTELNSRTPNKALLPTVQRCHDNALITDNYVTVNQKMLKGWSGFHCPQAYCEPQSQQLFHGNFNGVSVSQNDFTAHSGRPSTSCKQVAAVKVSNAKFNDQTTNGVTYTLPKIVDKEPLCLRKNAKKNNETMDSISSGKMDTLTQYQRDNPGFSHLPLKQGLCAPLPDSLQLFTGPQLALTETMACFNPRQLENAFPREALKKDQQRHANGGHFDDRTSFKTDFQPIPLDKICRTDKQAVAIGHYQMLGAQAKLAQDFGEGFSEETTNRVHFQPWKTRPRVCHGDQSEQMYRPSNQPFKGKSEMRSSFIVPIVTNPSESCKPLHVRVSQQNGPSMASGTTYGDHFLPKPLPHRKQCPAELLLR